MRQALLSRYEREAPSILREDEVKKAIANLRLKSELMAVQNVRLPPPPLFGAKKI
jgi:hypothetical protein